VTPDDRVRDRLRDGAEAYQPDRAAIASRVAAGRSAIRSKRDRMRPAGAALAVAAVVAVSVVVACLADEPDRTPAAAPAPAPSAVAGTTATPSATAAAPARTVRPFLTADGDIDDNSVATWTQNTVTVRTSRTVVDLAVTISVALTAGVAEAGRYTTVPNTDLTTDVRRGADALVYSYTLKAGRQLRPGTYQFAAQFDHRSGRRPGGDSYAVAARTGTGETSESGRFG
jgi:hypothetical protein